MNTFTLTLLTIGWLLGACFMYATQERRAAGMVGSDRRRFWIRIAAFAVDLLIWPILAIYWIQRRYRRLPRS